MKLLILSDIHGKTEGLSRLQQAAANADLLVVNGDLTHFGDADDARRVIAELKKLHGTICAVPGNCDDGEVAAVIESEGISIHRRSFVPPAGQGDQAGAGGTDDGQLVFYGIGGAMPGPVSTPNEYAEEDLEGYLAEVPSTGAGEDGTLLLVCHQPPHKTVADRAMKMKHVGSRVLREWMDRTAPLLLLTGHIHESVGSEWYGETCVVNPGAFKDGRYAEIELTPAGETGKAEKAGSSAHSAAGYAVEVQLHSL